MILPTPVFCLRVALKRRLSESAMKEYSLSAIGQVMLRRWIQGFWRLWLQRQLGSRTTFSTVLVIPARIGFVLRGQSTALCGSEQSGANI